MIVVLHIREMETVAGRFERRQFIFVLYSLFKTTELNEFGKLYEKNVEVSVVIILKLILNETKIYFDKNDVLNISCSKLKTK